MKAKISEEVVVMVLESSSAPSAQVRSAAGHNTTNCGRKTTRLVRNERVKLTG